MNKQPESDPSRAALFAGYNPAAIPRETHVQDEKKSYGGGGEGEEGEGGRFREREEEEEQVELIKRDMRGVKQESLGSTRFVCLFP